MATDRRTASIRSNAALADARDWPRDRGATFVGLVDPSMSMGVFLNLAPAPWFGDAGDDAVLDYLASNLYTGHGGHSIYAKTWAAGLAYSNGLHPFVRDGLLDYYAERCPLLPQTIRFVVDSCRRRSPTRTSRATRSRTRSTRGSPIRTRRAPTRWPPISSTASRPISSARFAAACSTLAKRADLADALFARMPAVYGKVLPGLTRVDPKATYFVIGPESSSPRTRTYLHAAVGKDDAPVTGIYPATSGSRRSSSGSPTIASRT